MAKKENKSKSLERWIGDAACSIREAKDAPKYKDYILPLIFTKRLCDVFNDELKRIVAEVSSHKKAFQLARAEHKLFCALLDESGIAKTHVHQLTFVEELGA